MRYEEREVERRYTRRLPLPTAAILTLRERNDKIWKHTYLGLFAVAMVLTRRSSNKRMQAMSQGTSTFPAQFYQSSCDRKRVELHHNNTVQSLASPNQATIPRLLCKGDRGTIPTDLA